jgi:hypothetical protein
VSFSADGAVAIVFFLRSFMRRFVMALQPPEILAEARAIDLSIQFLLFWMPLVTLLGWWLNKPISLLFGNEKKMSPVSIQYGILTLSLPLQISSRSSFSSARASLSTTLRQMPKQTGLRVGSYSHFIS